MTRRFALGVLAGAVLTLGSRTRLLGHEGHDHKVLGTVTMAAPDHLMVKDREGKDVTIRVTKATKVRSKPAVKVEEIKAGTRVVVTARMEKDVLRATLIEVGAAPAAR